MNDEERKELLIEMRYYMDHGQLADLIAVCGKASDEIERLVKVLAEKQASIDYESDIVKGLESECASYLEDISEMQESRNKWRAKAMPNGPFNYDDLPDDPREYEEKSDPRLTKNARSSSQGSRRMKW